MYGYFSQWDSYLVLPVDVCGHGYKHTYLSIQICTYACAHMYFANSLMIIES